MKTLLLLILTFFGACNVKECPKGLDFTRSEQELIPYQKDSLLIFTNDQGKFDTFNITSRTKRIVDKGFEIETSSHDWLEIEIRYTNKSFSEGPEQDRQLAWITKGCKDNSFGISASWGDFWDGLYFKKGDFINNYSYPDTIKNFPFNSDTLLNVLQFQTDTTFWTDATERNIKKVYWLPGEGVIQYETRKTGTWKKVR
jgi:hypothetical protein